MPLSSQLPISKSAARFIPLRYRRPRPIGRSYTEFTARIWVISLADRPRLYPLGVSGCTVLYTLEARLSTICLLNAYDPVNVHPFTNRRSHLACSPLYQ